MLVVMKLWVWLAVLGAACDEGQGPGERFFETHDDGQVCVRAANGDLALPADAPLTITFDAQHCFSSSCTRDVQVSCQVNVADRTVQITSEVTWYDTTASSSACTADCGMATASCQTPPLAAGEYTFVFGSHALAITLPSTPPARCLP